MTTTQSDLAGLSRFIFRTPNWYVSLGFALVVAAMAGVAAFDAGGIESGWRGLLFLGKDAWEGVFFIGIPTVVAAFGTTGVDRFVGGRLTYSRSSLLALTSEVILVVLVTGAGVIAALSSLGQRFVLDALVVGLASIFAFRLLVVMAVSRSSLPVASVPASLQTLTAAVLLFVYSGTVRFLEVGGPLLDVYLMPYLARADEAPPAVTAVSADHFFLLGVTCAIYAAAVYLFLRVVDRPWRRSLGVSMLDFLRGFVGYVAEGSHELEGFFEELGEEAVVPVTLLVFRRPDGTEKARFVLPMIHPGPMGEIGGGNLPERVATSADGLAFPPHATAGHDFNLVTEREVDPILDAVDRAERRIDAVDGATPSVRVASGEASVLGQRFGEAALLVSTFAPRSADDVQFGAGHPAQLAARGSGLDDVLLVDAHNCNDGFDEDGIPHVTPGSTRAFDLLDAAESVGERLVAAEQAPVELGVAWRPTEWDPSDGIGPLGIRAAVVDAGGQTTAYVLVDGNNMVPGLRELVVDALVEDGPVDAAEVMTTDTHVVTTVEAENQVGEAIDPDDLLAHVTELVDEALADREPVRTGMATERATVTVFGSDRTETLASHANAVVSLGGALAAAVILAAMAVSVLVFFLT
jgi:putative membrane protein